MFNVFFKQMLREAHSLQSRELDQVETWRLAAKQRLSQSRLRRRAELDGELDALAHASEMEASEAGLGGGEASTAVVEPVGWEKPKRRSQSGTQPASEDRAKLESGK